MYKYMGTTALAALLAGASFVAGTLFGDVAKGATNFPLGEAMAPEDVDLYPVWKAWYLLENRFVPATTTDPISNDERIWGMIQGLADSYGDPYTTFMPPVEAAQFEEDISGKFGGVGMEIGVEGGVLVVIAPLKNTPAERAGIRAGDKIVSINGEITQGLSVDDAISKIRGEAGSAVLLGIMREGEANIIEIEVVRDIIVVPTLNSSLRADGIYVISLYNFGAGAVNEFRAALRDMRQLGATKLIIDLRGNPGGYLDAAVDISSWFLPAGKVIVQEDFGTKAEPLMHRSKGYTGLPENISVVLLVNRGSASASEIVAGALKEHKAATVVGERTFGKGSVQELVPVTDETSLKVTIARWLTPEGHSISAGGLAPDIEVAVTEEDIVSGRDPQLLKAVEILSAK